MNKKLLLSFVSIASLITLFGCAPRLSEGQCQSMNWRQLGYNDGALGKPQRDLGKSIADCARFKLSVNTQAYAKGWRMGTRSYCTPNKAAQLGASGATYNRVCPKDLAGAFERAWRRGLRQYCVPGTGYSLGRAGKGLPSFCAPNQVVPFRNAYHKGLRIYQRQQKIQTGINTANAGVAAARNQIIQLRTNIRLWERQLDRGVIPGTKKRMPHYKRRQLYRQIEQAHETIHRLRWRIARLDRERARLQRQEDRVAMR